MTIHDFELDTLIFISLAILFCVEQLFCYYQGSYPYKYGLTVKRFILKDVNINDFSIKKLSIKNNKIKSVIYLHYKYSFGVFAPLVFVGVINKLERYIVEIKIGPLSLVFLTYISFKTIIFDRFISFGNFAIVGVLVLYLYYVFVQNVKLLGEPSD